MRIRFYLFHFICFSCTFASLKHILVQTMNFTRKFTEHLVYSWGKPKKKKKFNSCLCCCFVPFSLVLFSFKWSGNCFHWRCKKNIVFRWIFTSNAVIISLSESFRIKWEVSIQIFTFTLLWLTMTEVYLWKHAFQSDKRCTFIICFFSNRLVNAKSISMFDTK